MADVTERSTTEQPPADPEAAAYEALRKELESEEQGQPPQQEEPAETKPPAEEPAETSEPAKKSTELENLQRALKEAREAAKAEQARTDAIVAALREARDRRGQAEPEKKQTEAPKLPDVAEDPIGHFTGRIAQLEEALRYAYQGGQKQTQEVQAQLQEQAIWATVQAAEADLRDPRSTNHKADYDDACRHLETARIRQLDRMYPSDSAHVQALARQQGFPDANQYKLALLNQDRRSVAMHALQTGISPAQLYYDLALDSGYQPKANGKAPAGDQRGQQQIDAAKKGVKAATTLSGGAGRKGANDMSITDLADLFVEDPDAADKVWEQMARAGRLG